MYLHKGTRIVGLLLYAATGARACGQAGAAGFWAKGHQYIATLVATRREPMRADVQAFFAPVKDTLQVELLVDSLKGDSVFGRYRGDFSHFGVVGPAGDSLFAGAVRGDSAYLRLNAQASDAALVMRGLQQESALAGEWVSEASPRAEGTVIVQEHPR